MKTNRLIAWALLGLAAFSPQHSTLLAQGSAFTYQGRLMANGVPANGAHDFTFMLFNAASGGATVAATHALNDAPVSNGLFTVTLNFGSAAFDGHARWLQIAVRPGGSTGAYTNLAPRQPLTATPYAVTAGTVTRPINGSLIINGTVGSNQLAAGTAAANLAASGGLVLSAMETNASLLNAGYAKIGTLQAVDTWRQRINSPPPSAGIAHTAVWTGSEMIVWGGYRTSGLFNDGGRYDPATDTWRALATTGRPAPRAEHTAVWTGAEMIVWGGGGLIGGRYDPVADTWTLVSTNGAPALRQKHTAIWTGSEMIVWGGVDAGGRHWNDGGRYNPTSDTWIAITPAALRERYDHTAVWTGTEMIIWGGVAADGGRLNDGGRYQPMSNRWTALTASGAPSLLGNGHTAVWTGSEMIVWGGWGGGATYLNTGGRYQPAYDRWTTVTTGGVPAPRHQHTAVWTGSEMIIWGGQSSSSLRDGGRYFPTTDTWIAAATGGAPPARHDHSAIWTGSEMIVWGGLTNLTQLTSGAYLGETWSYKPGQMTFLYEKR